ncbi:hypothetical protein EDB47_12723 [Vibrio crassostreae]|nr:hypothetical protein EDB35_12626 [Vibrio crassostreae]TCT57507.1 hypothetical protein EDB44_12526 [Vibrio crassostreae]TCT72797.1 hypothetical protein EDB46_109181 [Vibrio crassostreae]TCT77923.1 hypothetical protein EDB43_12526 [Vibrio crassostreae]TCT99970.1 hypothetical protein EDB47_12723 [Vibrio crassostreae]
MLTFLFGFESRVSSFFLIDLIHFNADLTYIFKITFKDLLS